MSRPVRLALLAAALLSPAPADAMDDFMRASSSGPLAMTFCTKNSDGSKIEGGASKFCKAHGYDKLAAAVDGSFAAAVTKAPANIRPLLKRDQAWFNEMIQEAVRSQADQFPEFLHPGWEKRTSEMHYTVNARDHLSGLQRERIALLEGFDEKRDGLAGTWLAYNAIIKITIDKDGGLEANGWKWEQGDWKAGCDYEMSGSVKNAVFTSKEQGKNPDTLERDHAMLIVNRLDDDFARKRYTDNGIAGNADEAKCKRRLDISSTARLFPAQPSPDIDRLPGIR